MAIRFALLLPLIGRAMGWSLMTSLMAPPLPTSPTFAPISPPGPSTAGELLVDFARGFRGDFDNHVQVAKDAAEGLSPREGGGHEHIHCRIQPVVMPAARTALTGRCSDDVSYRLASYYFNGRPEQLFRERLYGLREIQDDSQFGHCVEMRIFKLREQTEQVLRESGGAARAVRWSASDRSSELLVPECSVFWRRVGDGFEGSLRTESVVVKSERTGLPLVVRDDISLVGDELWVNDRGTDLEGNYVYGNVRNVPYKLQRVHDRHWTSTGALPPDEPNDFAPRDQSAS